MPFLFKFVLKVPAENRSLTEPQLRKRERSSDGTDLENDPGTKKSKPFESSANEVKQSTSTSAREPPVEDPVSEQQPCTSQQRSVLFDSGILVSSGEDNAKQHGINEHKYCG